MDNFSYPKSILVETLQTYWSYLLVVLIVFSLYFYSPKKGIKNLFKGGGG